jgi:hypothetical protein
VANKRGRQITNFGGLFDPFAIGAGYRIRGPGTRDVRFAERRTLQDGQRMQLKAARRTSQDGQRAQLKAQGRGRHISEG